MCESTTSVLHTSNSLYHIFFPGDPSQASISKEALIANVFIWKEDICSGRTIPERMNQISDYTLKEVLGCAIVIN
jgi:hypothetical protein